MNTKTTDGGKQIEVREYYTDSTYEQRSNGNGHRTVVCTGLTPSDYGREFDCEDPFDRSESVEVEWLYDIRPSMALDILIVVMEDGTEHVCRRVSRCAAGGAPRIYCHHAGEERGQIAVDADEIERIEARKK